MEGERDREGERETDPGRRATDPASAGMKGEESGPGRGPAVDREYSLLQRLSTALCYAVSASLIVIINKLVLTTHRFPSFLGLGLGQMVVTVVILLILRVAGLVQFPAPHGKLFKQLCPLPLLFFGSIMFSLGGTQRLSLPMVIALRKFANLFILIGEYFILGVVATRFIQFTVFLMIFGSIVAASHDLAFDLTGYSFIMATNLCSSMTGVFTKKKLNAKTLGKFGLMFYNCLFMMTPTCVLAMVTGDLGQAVAYERWWDPVFVAEFLLACVMGFVVNFCTLLCTQYNSALTTSIVGVLKNLFIVYVGMFIGGDYVYSLVNFVGINISVVGGLMYSYATFLSKKPRPADGGGNGDSRV